MGKIPRVDDSSHEIKCANMFVSAIVFGNDYKQPCLVSAFPITGPLNFELLPNICCAIDSIKYICHIKIASVCET